MIVSILLLISALIQPREHVAPDSTASYSNAEFHYSLLLPAGWKIAPEPVLDEVRQSTLTAAKEISVRYVAVFQPLDRTTLAFPYILFNHSMHVPASLEQLVRSVADSNRDPRTTSLMKKPVVSKLEIAHAIIDRSRQMVRFESSMEVPILGAVKVLSACCPGRLGLVQINCYCLSADCDAMRPIFESMLDTIAFEPGFAWQDRQLGQHSYRAVFDWIPGAIFAVVFVAGYLTVRQLRRYWSRRAS